MPTPLSAMSMPDNIWLFLKMARPLIFHYCSNGMPFISRLKSSCLAYFIIRAIHITWAFNGWLSAIDRKCRDSFLKGVNEPININKPMTHRYLLRQRKTGWLSAIERLGFWYWKLIGFFMAFQAWAYCHRAERLGGAASLAEASYLIGRRRIEIARGPLFLY